MGGVMSGIMRTFLEAEVFRSLKRVISIEMDRTLVLFSNPSVRGKLANMWKRTPLCLQSR